MPKVHYVAKARKADKKAGIKKGDSYYWWSKRPGGRGRGYKVKSKTRPRASQLTSSEYLSTVFAANEAVEDAGDDPAALIEALQEAESCLDSLKDETEEKLSNVEEAFPNGCPVAEQLQERIDALEQLIGEIQDAINTIEAIDEDEDEEDRRSEALTAAEGVDFSAAAI